MTCICHVSSQTSSSHQSGRKGTLRYVRIRCLHLTCPLAGWLAAFYSICHTKWLQSSLRRGTSFRPGEALGSHLPLHPPQGAWQLGPHHQHHANCSQCSLGSGEEEEKSCITKPCLFLPLCGVGVTDCRRLEDGWLHLMHQSPQGPWHKARTLQVPKTGHWSTDHTDPSPSEFWILSAPSHKATIISESGAEGGPALTGT